MVEIFAPSGQLDLRIGEGERQFDIQKLVRQPTAIWV
jgi:hypothetical protein